MKKKIFNMFGTAVIAAILTFNVSIVLDGSSGSVLKWNLVEKILADDTSGSGDSGSSDQCTRKLYKVGSSICGIDKNGNKCYWGVCQNTTVDCLITDGCSTLGSKSCICSEAVQ